MDDFGGMGTDWGSDDGGGKGRFVMVGPVEKLGSPKQLLLNERMSWSILIGGWFTPGSPILVPLTKHTN